MSKAKNKKNKDKAKNQSNPNDKALAGVYSNEGVNAGNAAINKFLPDGSLGRVSTELAGSNENLARYRALYDKASTRDPAQTDVLNRMKGGLDGYTSQQYQAQREQMQRGLDSNLNTSMNQLAKAQARGKVYGAAAAAQQSNLMRGNEQNKNQLEQDLYVKNIDEMQKRLGEYGTYNRELTQEEYTRQADATKGYGDEMRNLRNEELDREKVNIGQQNAERSAQINLFTGTAGLANQNAAQKRAERIARESLRRI